MMDQSLGRWATGESRRTPQGAQTSEGRKDEEAGRGTETQISEQKNKPTNEEKIEDKLKKKKKTINTPQCQLQLYESGGGGDGQK